MVSLRKKKVLVTGGFGFIGSEICRQLAEKGAIVTALGRKKRPELFNGEVKCVQKDILSKSFLDFIKRNDFDYIVHMAGTALVWPSVADPVADFEANCTATIKLLETLRKKKKKPKFLYGSTIGVYGDHASSLTEKTQPKPTSPYGINKLHCDLLTSLYAHKTYGLKTFRIRYSSTYGPGLRKQFIYQMMAKIMNAARTGKSVSIWGTGKQMRDFGYVKDQARATLRIMEKSSFDGGVCNVGSGRGRTLISTAKTLAKLMGHPTVKIRADGRKIEGDSQNYVFDTAHMERLIGKTHTTGHEEGLKKTVEWFKRDVLLQTPFKSVTVVIPTYNEKENAPRIVKKVHPILQPYCKKLEILFVDDNSPDGTAKVIRQIGRKNKTVKLLLRKNEKGIGGAHRAGLERSKSDVTILLDADGSQDHANLIDFLYYIKTGAEMVVGSRYLKGSKIVGQPWKKKMASRLGNKAAALVLRKAHTDFTHSYRAITRKLYSRIRTKAKSAQHPDYCLELTVAALKTGLSVVEVPTTFTERDIGVSKLNLKGAGVRFAKRVIELR